MNVANAKQERAQQREVSKWLFGSLIAASFATTLTLMGAGVDNWHAHRAVRLLVPGTVLLVMELLVIVQPHRYLESWVMKIATVAGVLLSLIGLDLALWSFDPQSGALGVPVVVACMWMISTAEVRKREQRSVRWLKPSWLGRVRSMFVSRDIPLKDDQRARGESN